MICYGVSMARKITLLTSIFAFLLFSSIPRFFTPSVSAAATHIVISEVQVSGVEDSNLDFIELYNPTNESVDLSDMKLVKRTRSGTNDTNIVSFVSGDTISAHGFFLWCNATLAEQLSCDRSTSATIANNNSIGLRMEPSDEGALVDAVTIGTVDAPLGEGSAIDPDPEDGGSIERKAYTSSSVESMTSGQDMSQGNGEDTDVNSIDFIYRTVSEPQSSMSGTESPEGSTPSNTPLPSSATTITPTPTTSSSGSIEHVVISEVQIGGSVSTDEFIELYNPTDDLVDITGWKLQKKTASGSEYADVITLSGSMSAHGYYLVGHADYTGSVTVDIPYSEESVSSNNTVQLVTASLTVIDKVGMGSAEDFEGSGTASSPANGRSIERKAHADATSSTMEPGGADEYAGNGYDSDDNDADFILRPSDAGTDPQNAQSSAEPDNGDSSPPEPTVTPTAIPTTTTAPTQEPSNTPIPTDVPTTIPTQVPTVSPTDIPTQTPTPPEEPTVTQTPTPEPTHGPYPNHWKYYGPVFNTHWFFNATVMCRHEYRPIRFGFHTLLLPRLVCERVSYPLTFDG
jgi:hypothetical protein